MLSKRKISMSSSQKTGVPNAEISINSLLVWLFYFNGHITLDNDLNDRIKNFYGLDKDFLHPNIQVNLYKFYRILKEITSKNQNYLIKLCLHWKCVDEKMIKILDEEKFRIVELYVLADSEETADMIKDLLEKNMTNNINVFFNKDISPLIDVAEREVELFTKHFRTNYNSICLTGQPENNEIVKRYRLRMMSLRNLMKSDQEKYHKAFKQFAKQRFTEMKHIEKNVTNRIYGKNSQVELFKKVLKDYESTIKQYRANRKQIEQQAQTNQQAKKEKESKMRKIQESLWQKMIKIYQQQGFFYQILNRNLRIIKQYSIQQKWTVLAQPFSIIYQAIKNLHLRDRQIDKEFYMNKEDNFVYREGRIRESQLNDIRKAVNKIKGEKTQDQNKIIQDIFNGKRETKNLYLQFYGFLSTSTEIKVAIKRFKCQINQMNLNTDLKTDYQCLFKIKINNNQNIYKPEYSHLLHGFYRFKKEYSDGSFINEGQVLFNPLNVFKFVDIKEKMIVQQQLVDYEVDQRNPKELIYQIGLQYGSFYDFILDKNTADMTSYEEAIKKSYCYCYNIIKKTDQFDIGNVYAIENKWSQSKSYYESKVKGNDYNPDQRESKFFTSKLDNKNYFLSLSQVCDNIGQTSKAVYYVQKSIDFFKYMLTVDQNMLYLKYREKLFEMQQRIIDLWERVSDSLQMERETNRQIMEHQNSHQFKNHPSHLVRSSQLKLKKGVLEFQKGDLEISKNRFQQCQKQIQNAFEKVKSLKQNSFKKQYFLNLFCSSSYDISCSWSYQKFQNQALKFLGLEQVQLKKQALENIKKKAVNLSQDAEEVIIQMTKALKNKEQYKKIILGFKNAGSANVDIISSAIIKYEDLQKSSNDQLLNIIRKEITQIKKIDKKEDKARYDEKFNQIKKYIKLYRQKKDLTIFDGLENKGEDNFIKKFIERQRQNRQEKLIHDRDTAIALAKNNFKEEFDAIITEIQQTIKQMKLDCLSQYNSQIIIQRNKLLKIAWTNQDFKLAEKQIELITNHGIVTGQEKHFQLAKAYKIKGKISMKSQNYTHAVIQAQKSLEYHLALIQKAHKQAIQNERKKQQPSKHNKMQVYQEIELSLAELNEIVDKSAVSKDKFSHAKNIEMNSEFLESTLLRCKAKLYYVHKQQQKITKRRSTQNSELKKLVSLNLQTIKNLIVQIEIVLQKREIILKVSEIQVQFLEIYGLYMLIKSSNRNEGIFDHLRRQAFEKIDNCAILRNALYNDGNIGNLSMYCQIVDTFAANKYIYDLLLQKRYFEKIYEYYSDTQEKRRVKWKIFKAKFLELKYKPVKEKSQIKQQQNNSRQKQYLKSAISTLVSMNDSSLAKQTFKLQKQISAYDLHYEFKTVKKQNGEIMYKSDLNTQQRSPSPQKQTYSDIPSKRQSIKFNHRKHNSQHYCQLDNVFKKKGLKMIEQKLEQNPQNRNQNSKKIQSQKDITNIQLRANSIVKVRKRR